MSLWGFSRESTQTISGANTVAGIKKGYQPPVVAGDAGALAEKRNVIATSVGWVRRENRGTRTIEQVIVAGHPGSGLDYTSNTNLGNPDIAQVYVKLNANGVISANVSANLYVVFNTPIHFKASGNVCVIKLANTAGGNSAQSYFSNTAAQGRIVNANNTLVFRMAPLSGGVGSAKATYHVNAQAITVTGNPLYNPDDGTTASANLVITGATANNLLNGIGERITNFRVSPKGVA